MGGKVMKESTIIIMKAILHYNTPVHDTVCCLYVLPSLSAVGDSAALEESEHGAYTVDDVPFRVDRHTPRRRVLTPDSGMINSTGKKIKLDGQPRATKFAGI